MPGKGMHGDDEDDDEDTSTTGSTSSSSTAITIGSLGIHSEPVVVRVQHQQLQHQMPLVPPLAP